MSIAEYIIYSCCFGYCYESAQRNDRGRGWKVYCYSSAVFILIRAIERIVQP